ncbi:MAG: CRISPR-associated endonuclease Cas2 [Patescibacteria group bacterium]
MKKAADLGLRVLEAVDDGLIFMEGTRRYPHVAIGQGMEGLRRVFREEEARVAAQRLRDLRRRGQAKARKIGHRSMLVLTDKGKVAKLRLLTRSAPRRPDGKRLVVAFDIPERQRALRQTLRNFLRSCGCVRLQDSVWVSDREIDAPLSAWFKRLPTRSSGWVRLFLAEEI